MKKKFTEDEEKDWFSIVLLLNKRTQNGFFLFSQLSLFSLSQLSCRDHRNSNIKLLTNSR